MEFIYKELQKNQDNCVSWLIDKNWFYSIRKLKNDFNIYYLEILDKEMYDRN